MLNCLQGLNKFGNHLAEEDICLVSDTEIYTRVGISGTTAKSRQRKFVPSSHTGPLALVASSHKSQTKVGTLACFDFFVKERANYVKIRQCYSV